MQRLDTLDDISAGLAGLLRADPRLGKVAEIAGPLPLRRQAPGFASLVEIVVSQQVSKASADAIFRRLLGLVDPLCAENVLQAGDAVFREAGLSAPKQKTVLALAGAEECGRLDIGGLTALGAEDAMAQMTAIPGIGPWTAEVYLLFCAGHPDIFPARDVALQAAVGHALGHESRPGEKALAAIAADWSPWRGVAARLFWAYYAHMRGRDGAPGQDR